MSESATNVITPVGDWRHRAECRSEDPELFHPVGEDGRLFEAQVAAAKAVCGRCRVRPECLSFALAILPFGIAGGMTETERHRERARHHGPRRACGAPQRPAGGSQAEVANAGRDAIRAGIAPHQVAQELGVCERTATRWASQVGTDPAADTAEGSRGGNRAPLLISQQRNPQAGTGAAEGHRG